MRMNTTIAYVMMLALALAAAAGCKPRVKTPADFAKIKDPGGSFGYRAISSDEVTIAVKKRKNDPKGDVRFWAKVLKEKVPVVYAYTFTKDEDVRTNQGVEGKLLDFEVQQDEGTFTYMLGVFVKGKKLWLFEVGGKAEAVKAHRGDILQAIKSMRLP